MMKNRHSARRGRKRRICPAEIAENGGKRARKRERIVFIGDIFPKTLVIFLQVYYNKAWVADFPVLSRKVECKWR
jgi:hypothetical protein